MPNKFFLFEYRAEDIVTMRKKHPCGKYTWQVMTIGSDVKLKCCGCGHLMTMSRATLEKSTVNVERTNL